MQCISDQLIRCQLKNVIHIVNGIGTTSLPKNTQSGMVEGRWEWGLI